MENVAVEEKEGGEGLALGAGRHMALHGEEGEEALDLLGAHRVGVAEACGRLVETDVLFDPSDVGAFGFQGEAAQAGDVTDLVEQSHGGILPMRVCYRRTRAGNPLPAPAL